MSKVKNISIVLLPVMILLLLLALPVNAYAAQSPELAGGNFTASRTEQVTMSVTLTDNPGFTYLKVSVDYDENAITLVSASNGSVCTDMTHGTYYIWSSDEDVTKDGILITLVFRVNNEAPFEKTDITIECVECSNYNEEDVSLNVSSGSIDVICSHASHPEMFSSVITPSTCTNIGYTTYTCDCGYSYVADYKDANGHAYVGTVTEPTCTAMGYTTYTCSCTDSFVSDYVDSHGHNYQSTTVAPTCTDMGYTKYVCDACENSYIADYVDATGHTHTKVITPPTCITMGYSTFTCSCGDKYVTNYVEATGHYWGEWRTDTEATETEEGLKVRFCIHNCDITDSQTIPVVETEKTPIIEIAVIVIAVGILLLFVGMVCCIVILKRTLKKGKP